MDPRNWYLAVAPGSIVKSPHQVLHNGSDYFEFILLKNGVHVAVVRLVFTPPVLRSQLLTGELHQIAWEAASTFSTHQALSLPLFCEQIIQGVYFYTELYKLDKLGWYGDWC